MNADWILAWWNLVYVVPFSLGLLYLIVYSTSGLTFGESEPGDGAGADADADVHAEVDAGVHADVDADVHADVDADADADVDAEVAGAGGHGNGVGDGSEAGAHALVPSGGHSAPDVPLFMRVRSALGIGQVPLSIIIMVLFFSWGALGFAINNLLRRTVPQEWMVALVSLPAAAVGSVLLTRLVVKLVARWLPTHETYAHRRAELVGVLGEAVLPIDRAFGMAMVRDRQGDLFQVACRTYEDGHPIPKGKRVLLVDYSANERLFYVTESSLSS